MLVVNGLVYGCKPVLFRNLHCVTRIIFDQILRKYIIGKLFNAHCIVLNNNHVVVARMLNLILIAIFSGISANSYVAYLT